MEQNSAMNLFPENMVNPAAITVDHVQQPSIDNNHITLDVLRLDKIDPIISGNKWFKLHHYLQQAVQNNFQPIVTFGGAYSNHIIATACAAARAGLKSTGIIRGEQPHVLSHTLRMACEWGMNLKFLSRQAYNQKNDPAFIEALESEFRGSCIIPEGGAGEPGIQGAAGIMHHFRQEAYTHIICAMGTGTQLLGLVSVAKPNLQLVGIPVLNGFENWRAEHISTAQIHQVTIIGGYHFGGYAKKNPQLINFMNDWYNSTGIPSDFVYTGKLFFALNDLLNNSYFPADSRLLAIHSGGLQGNASLRAKTLVF